MSARNRFGLVVLALAAAFAAAAQPAAAGKKGPKPKPDFAVKSVSFAGQAPYYLLLDRADSGLAVTIKVRNQGKAAAAGDGTLTAGASTGPPRGETFEFDVPELGRGDTAVIESQLKGSDLAKINTYRVFACAEAKRDAKESNNCRSGPDLAAIPRTWVGTTDATWSDGFSIQSLVVNRATFTFDPPLTRGVGSFVYVPTGSLTGTITGSRLPGCSYSGTGDTAIDTERATLLLEPDLLLYRAFGHVVSTYPAQVSCDDGSGPHEQEFGIWLDTQNVSREASEEVLTGANALFEDSWSWNLRAE